VASVTAMPRVYLAHGKSDAAAAERLATGLLERGVRVWLAEWDVGLGEIVIAKNEEAIASAEVALVLFSLRGIEDAWMQQLYTSMLTQAVQRGGRLVIPVLDGIGHEDLPPMLAIRRSVAVQDVRAIAEAIERRLAPEWPRREGSIPTRVIELPGRERASDGLPRGWHVRRRVRLRVEGELDGQDTVRWRFVDVDRDEPIGVPRIASLHAVDAAMQALQVKGPSELAVRAVGEALLECLIGRRGEASYHALFRRLLGYTEAQSGQPTALAEPVACRVVIRDRRLLQLPWRLASDRERFLVDEGWTFEVATRSKPEGFVQLPNPCTLALIAPEQGSGGDWVQQHCARVLELLRSVWGSVAGRIEPYVSVVRTRGELDQLLRERAPHVAYVVSPLAGGECPAVWLDQKFGASEMLPLDELLSRLAERSVAAVYLGGPGTEALDLDPAWLERLPCVVVSRLGDELEAADRAGLSWLHGLLVQALDPVAAAHRVPSGGPSLQWAATQVHVGYRDWRTQLVPPPPDFHEAVLRIDRIPQRSRFSDRVEQLVQEPKVLAVSIVGHGTPEDEVGRLGDQLYQHLDERGRFDPGERGIRPHRRLLRFPPGGEGLRRRLHDALRQAVGIVRDEDPAEAVLRLIARDPPKWSATLLWLDWGHVGVGAPVSRIADEDVETWLRFGAEELPRLSPARVGRVRVISTLGVAVHPDDLDPLTELVRELRQLPGVQTDTVTVEALPTLDRVDACDLEQVLRKPALRCPEDLVIAAAHAIVSETGGRYAAVIETIREMRDGGTWTALVQRVGMPPTKGSAPRNRRTFGQR
jgi:hypothetical protein